MAFIPQVLGICFFSSLTQLSMGAFGAKEIIIRDQLIAGKNIKSST